ncbi:uncharacterized protein LOC142224841 [Haematobia irritans]|uniref:uncharacterized protein LOC142224841 n=1 Tax=Haematobia irritans TaxID=7368 RepID=UPI003F507642
MFGLNMITHGSSYSLLRNLGQLDEPMAKIDRSDQLQSLRQEIRKHHREAYEQNREQCNLRAILPNFRIGQEVFRRNFAQSNFEKSFYSKLAPMFLKALIREKLGSHYFILEDMNGQVVGTYHAKDIRP